MANKVKLADGSEVAWGSTVWDASAKRIVSRVLPSKSQCGYAHYVDCGAGKSCLLDDLYPTRESAIAARIRRFSLIMESAKKLAAKSQAEINKLTKMLD